MENGAVLLENNLQFLKFTRMPRILLQGIYPGRMKRDVHTKTYMGRFTEALFSIVKFRYTNVQPTGE
jgi:hypothetical protein